MTAEDMKDTSKKGVKVANGSNNGSNEPTDCGCREGLCRFEAELREARTEIARLRVEPAGNEVGAKRARESKVKKRTVELPTEIWAKIAGDLDGNDIFAFALTSKQHREAQQQSRRKLETAFMENSTNENLVYFSSSWCMWTARRFNASETRKVLVQKLVRAALVFGYVEVLDFLKSQTRAKNSFLFTDNACHYAAYGGHIPVLQWLRNEDKSFSSALCYDELLSFALFNGDTVCIRAAKQGFLPVLVWLKNQVGYKWKEWTFNNAVESGNVEVLEWLLAEGGCPRKQVNACSCWTAAQKGHLSVLKFLRSQDPPCPWDRWTPYYAAGAGYLKVFGWAVRHGCPWDRQACRSRARTHNHPELERWIKAQV